MIRSEVQDKYSHRPSEKEDDWCVNAGGEMEAEVRSMERREWWEADEVWQQHEHDATEDASLKRAQDDVRTNTSCNLIQGREENSTHTHRHARTHTRTPIYVTIWKTGVERSNPAFLLVAPLNGRVPTA